MLCTHDCPTLSTNSSRRMCIDVLSPYETKLNIHSLSGLQTYLRTNETDLERLKAAFIQSKLWAPRTNLIIGFLASTPSETSSPASWEWKRAWVAHIISQTLALYPNVTFTFQLDPSQGSNATIRISFDETQGCYSRIGTDALQDWGGLNNSMNLGWMDAPLAHTFTYNNQSYTTPSSFDQGGYPGQGTVIVHEFGHAMGMIHEHQTPFNNPLVWNTQAVYQLFEGPPNNWSAADVNNNILTPYSGMGMNGSAFDPYSIMKYSFPSNLLLTPTPALASEVERFNLVLSGCDKYWLATNYPGKVSATDLAVLESQCSVNTNGMVVGTSSRPVIELLIVVVVLWFIWSRMHKKY